MNMEWFHFMKENFQIEKRSGRRERYRGVGGGDAQWKMNYLV